MHKLSPAGGACWTLRRTLTRTTNFDDIGEGVFAMDTLKHSTMVTKALAFTKRSAILFTAALAACQGTAPDDLLLDTQPTALVFVKSNDSSTLDNNFIGGGEASDLYMLTPISPNG